MTIMGQQCPNSMFINPVSEDEVVNIIISCTPKHSKDCDDINMYVLSKVTDLRKRRKDMLQNTKSPYLG